MHIAFEVEGRPVPQGSMVASYNRRLGTSSVHHVQGAALAAWRADIRREARAAGAILSPLPIYVDITFGMPRPEAHMQWRGGRHIVKVQHYYDLPAVMPDLDKLIRAVLDALTGVCYTDDSRVVEIHARKAYANTTTIEVTAIEDKRLSAWVGSETETHSSEGQLPLSDVFQGEGDHS